MMPIGHSRAGGNPDLFQRITVLDAGSSPAWRPENSRFSESWHSLPHRSDGLATMRPAFICWAIYGTWQDRSI